MSLTLFAWASKVSIYHPSYFPFAAAADSAAKMLCGADPSHGQNTSCLFGWSRIEGCSQVMAPAKSSMGGTNQVAPRVAADTCSFGQEVAYLSWKFEVKQEVEAVVRIPTATFEACYQ